MRSDAGLPGMDVIGPGLWVAMHFMALHAHTPQRRAALLDFMHDLANDGPCSTCSSDFSGMLKDFNKELRTAKDADKLFEVTVDMHNVVNEKLHKRVLSLSEARDLFETGCGETTCIASVPESPLRQGRAGAQLAQRNATLADYRNVDVHSLLSPVARTAPAQRRVMPSNGVRPKHSYEEAVARHWRIHG